MFAVEVYATVRQLVFNEGKSRREVARLLGLSRDTVGKMCRFSASSSPFDLRGVSVTGEAGSDDLARAGVGRLSLIQRRHGGARPLDRRRAALLRGLPGPAHGTQRLLRHG